MLITDADTNKVFFSRWITDFSCYTHIKDALLKYNIEYALLPYTQDWWVRDFMPIQLTDKSFLGYKFNPDYLQDKRSYITHPERCYQSLNINVTPCDLVIDGGNVIKTADKVIMTDKIFTENKDLSKIELINALEKSFGHEIVFIPWDREEKFGHADGMVRYIENNTVLINHYKDFDKELRKKMLDILQPHFEVIELGYDIKTPIDWIWVYINYLRIGNIVLLPGLGIEEDEQAVEQFSKIFPQCTIEQVIVPEIVEEGGGLNCVSWNIKI